MKWMNEENEGKRTNIDGSFSKLPSEIVHCGTGPASSKKVLNKSQESIIGYFFGYACQLHKTKVFGSCRIKCFKKGRIHANFVQLVFPTTELFLNFKRCMNLVITCYECGNTVTNCY